VTTRTDREVIRHRWGEHLDAAALRSLGLDEPTIAWLLRDSDTVPLDQVLDRLTLLSREEVQS
jgi:hypothetical protein